MNQPGQDEWPDRDGDALIAAVLSLRSAEQAERFLRDLCTLRELEEMSRRWAVVRLLDEGLSYREVASRTGTSTATVTRISYWLQHGTGGYRLVLDGLSEEDG